MWDSFCCMVLQKPLVDWIERSNDLTNKCGYQQHQMAVQYYKMHRQLTELQVSINDSLEDHGSGFFHCFIESLKSLGDPIMPLEELKLQLNYQEQRSKALKFVDISLESLHKHFGWWCTNQLLPAALLSKPGVLAAAVARLILGHDPAPPEMKDYPVIQGAPEPSSPLPAEEISHYDKVHGSSFKPSKFEAFIIEQYQRSGGGAFSESAKAAATLLLNGEDFRAQLTKSESHPVVWEIRRSFQPMPSQTQMIE